MSIENILHKLYIYVDGAQRQPNAIVPKISSKKIYIRRKIMDYVKNSIASFCKKNKVNLIFLVVCLLVIFVSSFCASCVQSDGFTVKVTDLRDETNTGSITNTSVGEDGATVETETAVKGKVVSGILFVPNNASAENPLPAVVLTHGYLNNREMQLQNAIELARRGFIVLTVDREGHGNYDNSGSQNAMMATNGLYDSAKYLYNLDIVDKSKIGISGHSMGGYTTAATLAADKNVGIVSAGLMQAWSSFMGAGSDVSVGFLKAKDDEFFFTTKENGGTIARDYLSTATAKKFLGLSTDDTIVNKGIYKQTAEGGVLVTPQGGEAVDGTFRAIYEIAGVHPQNHESVEGANAVVNFFYNAFGTPSGHKYIAESHQTWWVKEMFSLLGLIAVIAMIFPLVGLLLKTRFFKTIAIGEQVANENGEMVWVGNKPIESAPLHGVQKHLTYWIGAIAVAIFSGLTIQPICTEFGKKFFPNTQLYPQDTTNWVCVWAVCTALFALAVVLFLWAVNGIVNRFRYKENAPAHTENPFAAGRIQTGVTGLAKTLLLGIIAVASVYVVTYINWQIWTVDFRIWTLAIKVFNVEMLPTMMRYALFFGIFFCVSALFNEGFRAKNLPEWATILINVFFNIVGVLLMISIQYGVFTTSGVLWQKDMALGYIVLIPMVPILAIATVISRRMTAKTGNVWLGAIINTLLFTMITCANTAASFAYVLG